MAATAGADECLAVLRQLSLPEFGELMFGLPSADLPALSRVLPSMPPAQIQIGWTGSAGAASRAVSVEFVQKLGAAYEELTGGTLAGRRILDYGCGYGRMLRLVYWFTELGNIYGFDPSDESLALCEQYGLLGTIEKSDFLPESLPCAPTTFDLIYCFSVFTHTSARAARLALRALRDRVTPDGLVVITIRPRGYWAVAAKQKLVPERKKYEKAHDADGFAFYPHNRAPIDGDVTYGDTSMTLDYFRSNFPFFEIVKQDDTYSDRYQRILYLKPA